MANFSLRRYDTQARVSVLLSAIAILPLIAMVVFAIGNIDTKEMILYYGPTRKVAVLGSALCSLMLAASGFGLGLNSVGQRRNDKQQLSWLGFFMGAGVLALTFVMIALWYLRSESVIH